jgi:hypothetical protein
MLLSIQRLFPNDMPIGKPVSVMLKIEDFLVNVFSFLTLPFTVKKENREKMTLRRSKD